MKKPEIMYFAKWRADYVKQDPDEAIPSWSIENIQGAY